MLLNSNSKIDYAIFILHPLQGKRKPAVSTAINCKQTLIMTFTQIIMYVDLSCQETTYTDEIRREYKEFDGYKEMSLMSR